MRSVAAIVAGGLVLLGLLLLFRSPCALGEDGATGRSGPGHAEAGPGAGAPYQKPSRRDLMKRLTPLQWKVTQEDGTEPPFENEYWNNKAPGIYVDVASGEPLFSSHDKYASGTGWPSFTRPLVKENLVQKKDTSWGRTRVEVRSRHGDSHLGHVFPDGPAPTGLRYCMNSAAMRFIPARRLAAEGYGAFAHLFPAIPQDPAKPKGDGPAGDGPAGDGNATSSPADQGAATAKPAGTPGSASPDAAPPGGQPKGADGGAAAPATPALEVATLAGGCFWGVEDIIRKLPGVTDTQVGYTGGTTPHPTYRDVKTGRTGHAEAVRVVFDPRKVTYGQVLDLFFRLHDPTTKNRQGNDRGTQYRSVIFWHTPAQRREAEAAKKRAAASGRWKAPIVTEIVKAGAWADAEPYHQDYLVKHPGGYTCHWVRD